jgi:hypothetical protein
MNVQQRIVSTMERVRKTWALGMVLATLLVVFNLPFWYTIFLIPLGIITYYASITLAAVYLGTVITQEDLEAEHMRLGINNLDDALSNGEIKVGTEEHAQALETLGVAGISEVADCSEEIVGRFGDVDIHEWIVVMDPQTSQEEKYFYHSLACLDGRGIPLFPKDDTKTFAMVNGLFYARDL